MLPWFKDQFPLFLAPMAGITDSSFRRFCREQGADVLVTEFVSAEGIFHRNSRTRDLLAFETCERPLGVQLFGADPEHLGEAARHVLDWIAPDFIDINFGCPVNKVVSRNGGSALLKDCPLLAKVATAVVKAAAPHPVTAKIRIGWNASSVNAVEVGRILESCGIQALAVHGRTKEQSYSGEADWNVIAEVAQRLTIPVIGNGDIASGPSVAKRKAETGVAGVMIGRAAMSSPWVFREIKHFLQTGEELPKPSSEELWGWIERQCREAVAVRGAETPAMHSLRARLMAYTKGLVGGKWLRRNFQKIERVDQIAEIRDEFLALQESQADLEVVH